MTRVKLTEFLTDAQIAKAAALYAVHGMGAVSKIQHEVIDPNMAAINARLRQDNDARYLAYAVVYVLSRGEAS